MERLAQVGRYLIEAEVARGGMGAVYRATDPEGQTVALKLLLAGRTASSLLRRRVATEIQSLLRLRHPHVVALLDAGEHQGVPYLVMEWVEGESLAARLGRQGPLDPHEAVELVRRLAEALGHCHAQGVLHRDLKPDNVLLRARDGAPLLVDFGLGKDLASESHSSLGETSAGRWLGTPGWWPPEQARGQIEAIGPRSDVYGLGAVLYGALTGGPPQAGETLLEVLAALEQPPLPPGERRRGVPPWLDAVVLRALALDPARRQATPAELARELQGRPLNAPAVRRLEARIAIGLLLVAGAAGVVLRERGPTAVRAPAALDLAREARAAWRSGQHERALELAATHLADPGGGGWAEAHLVRAQVELEREDRAAAGEAARRARDLATDPADQALGAALAAWSEGDELAARGWLDGALGLRSEDADAAFWRGALRAAGGDPSGALEDFTRAIGLDPRYALAHRYRGDARETQGDLPGAIRDYDRAIELDPGDALAHNNRGYARKARGTSRGRSRTTTGRSSSTPAPPRPTRTEAKRGRCRGTSRGRSRTTTGRSSSTPAAPRPTATAAPRGTRWETSRARSRTTTGRSSSTPAAPRPTATAAPRATRWETSRGRSRTTTGRSGSTPGAPRPTATAAPCGTRWETSRARSQTSSERQRCFRPARPTPPGPRRSSRPCAPQRFPPGSETWRAWGVGRSASHPLLPSWPRAATDRRDRTLWSELGPTCVARPRRMACVRCPPRRSHEGQARSGGDRAPAPRGSGGGWPGAAGVLGRRGSRRRAGGLGRRGLAPGSARPHPRADQRAPVHRGQRTRGAPEARPGARGPPGSADALFWRGGLRLAQGDYAEAVEPDPRLAGAYTSRGNALLEQGDLAGAVEDYTRAIEIDPRHAGAYTNRGSARHAQGNLMGAIEDHTRAIAIDPQAAAGFYNRGNARVVQGDLTGAIEDYTRATAVDPRHAGAYTNRGNARAALGDLVGAVEDYDRAIAIDPRHAMAHANRGLTRRAQGDLAGAVADFERAAQLFPPGSAEAARALLEAPRGRAGASPPTGSGR